MPKFRPRARLEVPTSAVSEEAHNSPPGDYPHEHVQYAASHHEHKVSPIHHHKETDELAAVMDERQRQMEAADVRLKELIEATGHFHEEELPSSKVVEELSGRLFQLAVEMNRMIVSHTHEEVVKHNHRDLWGHLQGVIRALVIVLEAGSLNSAQAAALHQVRVIIGDAHGKNCQHENVVYEEDDILVCQDCREVVKAEAGG